METTKELSLNNKVIKFTNIVDENDESKIYTSRYFYMDVRGQRQPMMAKQNKDEYYSQLEIQLTSLQGKKQTEQDFCEALFEGCRQHIIKYGRLIISDLWAQLNITMHLVDATKGIFHNHIETLEEGIELRNYYLNVAQQVLIDFILVPDPNEIGEIGRPPKLIPLKSLKS
jgi:hypothetical protein